MSASCSKMAQVHCCLSNLRYGYPVKHPLSEQFGMTLLQPLRLWKEILFSLFGLTKQLHPTILFAFIEQAVKTFKLSFTTCWVAGNMLLNTCTKIIANLYALSETDYCFSSPQATMLHACMFAALCLEGIGCPVVMKSASWSTLHRHHCMPFSCALIWWCKIAFDTYSAKCYSILTGWFGWFALETSWRKHVLQLRGQFILMHFASCRSLCIEHGKETCLNVLAIIGYRWARVMMPT